MARFSKDLTRPHNECEIDGKRMPYSVCSDDTLEEAIEYYGAKRVEHIGSSYITYHNGVKNTWPKLHHFFNWKTI